MRLAVPSEALTLQPNMLAGYNDQQLQNIELQFLVPARELQPAVLAGLGKHALRGANVQLASDFPQALVQARERNEAIIDDVVSAGHQRESGAQGGTTLRQRQHLAAAGEKNALAAIEIDALTEVTEQMCKAGAILKVQTRVTEDGQLEQFGQTTEMRQRNTLKTYSTKSSALRETLYAEGQNGFFIEEAHKRGLLKGKRVVEFSLIPDDKHEVLAKHGYYLREVIGIMRVTTIDDKGKCDIVSVLVGGTDQELLPPLETIETEQAEIAAEKQALANRYDIATVRNIYDAFGKKNAHRLSTEQLLAEPLIIDDTVDHLDVAMLYDRFASQYTGKPLLLGLPMTGNARFTKADYKAHEAKSLDFQAKLKTVAGAVANEAIRRRHEAKTDLQAARLFHTIAQNHAVSHMLKDKAADIRVFGAQTFHLAIQARRLHEAGDFMAAKQYELQAQQKAKGTGCPGEVETETGSLFDKLTSAINKALGRDSESLSELEKRVGKLKKGKCVVDGCPSSPKEVTVGGCGVCIDRCQKMFDAGKDPTKLRPVEKVKKAGKQMKTTAVEWFAAKKQTV